MRSCSLSSDSRFSVLLSPDTDGSGASKHLPMIYARDDTVAPGGSTTIFWDIPDAEDLQLWVLNEGEKHFSQLAFPEKKGEQTVSFGPDDFGTRQYAMLVKFKDGEWAQSNIVYIKVRETEEHRVKRLESCGMDNVWNVLFMIYRTVHVGDYLKSFSDEEVAAIRWLAGELKPTIEGLSDGRMRIGTVNIMEVADPVTSASGPSKPPTLVYGPEGDVDFNYILDHKDVNMVLVYAPLSDMTKECLWNGLGGTYMDYKGQLVYHLIANCVSTSRSVFTVDGRDYPLAITLPVHEMLHGIETNSRHNGFDGFETLHSHIDNGYPGEADDFLIWYHDLTRDRLKNGKKGFLPSSFYIAHKKP